MPCGSELDRLDYPISKFSQARSHFRETTQGHGAAAAQTSFGEEEEKDKDVEY
jgi:hypothetical protein